MSELQDTPEAAALQKVWEERFKGADTPEEFIRRFNQPVPLSEAQMEEGLKYGFRHQPSPGAFTDKQRLAASRQAYEEFDRQFGTGGSYDPARLPEGATPEQEDEYRETVARRKFEHEKALYRQHGERPAPLTAKEAVEEERIANRTKAAELKAELEHANAKALVEMNGASSADRWSGNIPQPSLNTNKEGVRYYYMPDGKTVPEYIPSIVDGSPFKNPEFVTTHERLTGQRNQ